MQTLLILDEFKLPPIKKNGLRIVTPVDNLNIKTDLDWLFPDIKDGIRNGL
jgi:hypothetical protein